MPIRPFMQPGAFDPEAIAAMSEAFEVALKEIQDTGQPDVVREIIAQRIIQAARLKSVTRSVCGQPRSASRTSVAGVKNPAPIAAGERDRGRTNTARSEC